VVLVIVSITGGFTLYAGTLRFSAHGWRTPLLVALAALAARTGYGQSQEKEQTAAPTVVVEGNHLQPTAVVRERRAGASATEASNPSASSEASSNSLFDAAATRNNALRYELTWAFGGKQQRGWSLYNLLIQKTVDSPAEPGSNDFATAIATWQTKIGLTPTGILDEDSFKAMFFAWQGDRLKDKTPALPEQLLIAPSSDFFDPARLEELRQVEKSTYAAYKQMLAAAIADPTLKLAHTSDQELAREEKFFKIISAFRSKEYQEKLRRESPHAGSAGLAVNSPHFSGRALDLYVGGEPVETKDANRALQVRTPAYQWLVRNAHKFGFRPYFYEPWHWEYVGADAASR